MPLRWLSTASITSGAIPGRAIPEAAVTPAVAALEDHLQSRHSYTGARAHCLPGLAARARDRIDAFHPQTILAHSLNDVPLPVVHGAPLRLRVERQLGYKHAKYVMRIDVTDRLDGFGRGKGGFWEDRGYEWYAGI
jgi:Oxidoreductase molybdopterin binding domain